MRKHYAVQLITIVDFFALATGGIGRYADKSPPCPATSDYLFIPFILERPYVLLLILVKLTEDKDRGMALILTA